MWDFAGRAKWDSWTALGRDSAFSGPAGQANAERDYQAEATKMGWPGGGEQAAPAASGDDDELQGVGKGSGMKRGKKDVTERMVHVSQLEEDVLDEEA